MSLMSIRKNDNWYSPLAIFRSAWRNRSLIWRLATREITSRWRGTVLGGLWSFATPLLIFAVYSFVFTVIFTPRWTTSHTGAQSYPLLLFAGILTFNIFSDATNRAPTLILENTAYVKKVVFPLEILPWVSLIVSLVNALFGYVILGIAYVIILGVPPATALLSPIMLIPICLICIGFGWLLSSLAVFIRDVRQLVSVMTTLLMFLSPVFFSMEGAPPRFKAILTYNPLAAPLEGLRSVLFWNELPDFRAISISTLQGAIIALVGWLWFARTRKAFADVL
jgi:lipopolysaccharide transport system permease protein